MYNYLCIIMCIFNYKNIVLLIYWSVNVQCLQHPDGVVYMAAKKYYFGVGGGTQRFLSMVEKDGELALTYLFLCILKNKMVLIQGKKFYSWESYFQQYHAWEYYSDEHICLTIVISEEKKHLTKNKSKK